MVTMARESIYWLSARMLQVVRFRVFDVCVTIEKRARRKKGEKQELS